MPNTRIQGNLAVTINSTIAGNSTVNGNSKIKGNLCVQGWLDAQNLRTPCKGLFGSAEALKEAYPRPRPGWWALVGEKLPAAVYSELLGRWAATGATAGDISIDLDAYDNKIAEINETINTLTTAVEIAAEHPITVADTNDADFIVADESGSPLISIANGHIHTALFDSDNLTVADTTDADLVIADEHLTPLLTVAGGHIRTALFDSAAVSSAPSAAAHRLQGKRLSILGDSISTFAGYIPSGYKSFYPAGNITSAAHTWWRQVIEATGMELLRNCSWSGSLLSGSSDQAVSETSAECGCSERRVSDLAISTLTPDVVIIFIGINDWGHASMYGYPLGSFDPAKEIQATDCFCGAYATAIKKVVSAYPGAEVYCCTLPTCTAKYSSMTTTSYPYLNGYGVPLALYNEAISKIAQACGVRIIRLDQCGFSPWNNATYTIDGLHPNIKGAGIIAKEVINALN